MPSIYVRSYLQEASERFEVHRSDWLPLLYQEFQKPYMKKLDEFLTHEVERGALILPETYNVFRGLAWCPHRSTRVVIIGQDPYHQPEVSDGLAFSTHSYVDPLPRSLSNILKELKRDIRLDEPDFTSHLGSWATQGVLLLNRVLTVEARRAGSHQGKGWEEFTQHVVDLVSDKHQPVVFLLWGNEARELAPRIAPRHLVIESPHPSPHSASKGFFFSSPFTKANAFLRKHGIPPVSWESIDSKSRIGWRSRT